MAHPRLTRVTGAMLGCWAVACGGTPAAPAVETPPPPTSTDARPAQAQSQLPAGQLYTVRSAKVGLEVSLPEPNAWQLNDSARWLEATHPATHSALSLRVWRASRLVRTEECQAQVALWRNDLPEFDVDHVVDERSLQAPNGFSGKLSVMVLTVAPKESDTGEETAQSELHGWVQAYTVTVGKCFAALFHTRAVGAGAEAAVAARLAIVTDRILPTVVEPSVDSRAPRQEL